MDEFLRLVVEYLRWLFEIFKGDLHVFSQWWLYAPLLIPFIGYTIFFVAKWTLITLPIWVTLRLAFAPFRWLMKITAVDKNKAPIDEKTMKALQWFATQDQEKIKSRFDEIEADQD